MDERPEFESLDSIYDALDAGNPEEALRLCLARIDETGNQDPVLQFFAGKAWMELGDPGRAIPHLEQARKLDPDDPEFSAEYGIALFEDGRFDPARMYADQLLEKHPDAPEGHYLRGLLAEREGAMPEADRCFEKAAAIDPERYPVIRRFTEEEFHAQVDQAADHLPGPFRSRLREVAVLVETLVPDGLLEDGLSPGETLGLFTGTPAAERGSSESPLEEPPRILLFQRNLERYAAWEDDLERQIAVTLFHELGHYLGMEEEDLEQAGFL